MVRAAIVGVVQAVTGTASEHADLARGVHTAIGLQALADIREDFIRKARGGLGEDGVRWPKLSPKTLAYARRFGRGEQTRLKRLAGLGRAHSRGVAGQTGLLTAAQAKRWRSLFARNLAWLAARSGSLADAKARAAQIAWATLKREGAKTKLEVFGSREVEILRDTSILLNSLSPGVIGRDDAVYQPPQDQIFSLTGSGVIVGTNVPYASAHQRGTKRGIPARPFLPQAGAPKAWTARWASVAANSSRTAIRLALERLGR